MWIIEFFFHSRCSGNNDKPYKSNYKSNMLESNRILIIKNKMHTVRALSWLDAGQFYQHISGFMASIHLEDAVLSVYGFLL